MKSILLLLVFVPFISFAQTNTFPSSGNVGIGTTSPQYQLDVSGVIRASQSLYTNYGTHNYGSAHWRLTTNNTLRIGLGLITNETGGNQGSDFSIWRYGDDGSHLANSFFIKRSSGNVGIGTTSPQYQLDVSGVIRASQSLYTNYGTDNYGSAHWRLTTNNTLRIGLGLITNETGGNQGSDFSIWRYGDDGSYLANSFFIKRSNGNVGIGTAYPETSLHVIGDSRFNGSGWFSRNNNGTSAVALSLGQNLNYDFPAVQLLTSDNGGSNFSYWHGTRWGHFIKFQRSSSVGVKNMAQIGGTDEEQFISVYSVDGSTEKIRLVADGSSYIQGNVGIGTTNPQAKLAVNGDIFSKKVKVTQTGWPDYVFHSSYKLLPLKDLEAYIQQNTHLPEVPSANEVEKNGLDLGDNQATLLKKIEELTLYIISQDKEIKILKDQNKELQDIKKDLETIKANFKTK